MEDEKVASRRPMQKYLYLWMRISYKTYPPVKETGFKGRFSGEVETFKGDSVVRVGLPCTSHTATSETIYL